ncbi:MAG TPA: thioredoxin fold domain-containing protein [Desulfobacteraceae bacterium]|nr:thioredoxin fold domain-containing protein [Desulfobacteraceae bacterium]
MKKIKALLLTITITAMIMAAPATARTEGIQWQTYEKGLAMAEAQGKKIFLYFHADWCTYCKQMKATTFQDAELIKYLTDNFISIAVDSDHEKKIATSYGVRGLPTLWLLKADTERFSSLPGFVNADRLINVLKYFKTESYAKMSFGDFLDTI